MASRESIVSILTPLAGEVAKVAGGRGEHDPIMLVQERLERLLDLLRDATSPISKMQVLQELGFLSEHSLTEELSGFHEVVIQAIDEAMTSGWE